MKKQRRNTNGNHGDYKNGNHRFKQGQSLVIQPEFPEKALHHWI